MFIKSQSSKINKGFTVMEIIIVISVLAVISAMTFFSFLNMNKAQALEKSALSIKSVLQEARAKTLSSEDSSNYGVRFEEDRAILFKGSEFDPESSDNRVIPLHALVEISETNLSEGGQEVVFERLTGKTAQDGNVALSLKGDPGTQKFITIYTTGLVQIDI